MATNITLSTENASIHGDLNTLNDEIRLLLLQPSKDPEAQVQSCLKKVSLNDNPAFEALSYAWGDSTVVESILLDDQVFKVTFSAWSALKALRYEDRPRILWIDAICINQDNLDERASQVKLMGTIYRKASSVRVWLGLDHDGDNEAVAILKAMRSTQGVQETLGIRDDARDRMAQVQRFFERSWWERLWVVQEVALGQHIVFQQGSKELEYKELLTSYRTSDAYFREHLKGYSYGAYSSGAEKFMEIFESVNVLNQIRELCGVCLTTGDKTRVRESTMTWATAANLLRNRKASVDRDRLYALYGLLPSSVVQSPGMEPSYSATTEEAFIDVTYSIMESSRSLMMFNFLYQQRSDESARLPSWVPDWRQAPANKYEANLRVAREQLFNASKDTQFHLQRLSSNTICLKGFFVDIVQTWRSASLFPSASPMLDGIHNMWRETWANTHPDNAMLKNYLDGTTAETAFRRTMVWDCQPGAEEGILKRLAQEEGLAMFEAHDLAVKIAFGEDMEVLGQNLSATDARRTNYMLNCAKERAFFVTASGLIGMTQINVQAGDHIFVVAGNSHPIILRPSKKYADTWHAVGECYLHSFMDGAGVKNIKLCAQFEKFLYADAALQSLKGTERNPIWDEVTEQPDGLWKWLLVE
jgi:hypothetical protein